MFGVCQEYKAILRQKICGGKIYFNINGNFSPNILSFLSLYPFLPTPQLPPSIYTVIAAIHCLRGGTLASGKQK